jgi:hypothetical protein
MVEASTSTYIHIVATDPDYSTGLSLLQLIQEDPETHGVVSRLPQEQQPGSMGVGEVVLTGLFSASTLGSLLSVLKLWLSIRRHAVIRLESREMGLSIEYDGQNDDAVAQLIGAVQARRNLTQEEGDNGR